MIEIVAGIDVGNSTTEVAIARIDEENKPVFMVSGTIATTGIKGTKENTRGIIELLERMTGKCPDLRPDLILLNDATPVISDFAMDTITETVITDSAMIGHNPDTPGGSGLGSGHTADLDNIPSDDRSYVVVVPQSVGFIEAAERINDAVARGRKISGAILQLDEGTLVNNRLDHKIPIVDEVKNIEKVPIGMPCAMEVAQKGRSIRTLSDPYGLASIFGLTPDETRLCRQIAKALIGNRSAVVIKTPRSDITTRIIPAGSLELTGKNYSLQVDVDDGADRIMEASQQIGDIRDVSGQRGTNAGGMIENLRNIMAASCEMDVKDVRITDLFAVDSCSAVPVHGRLSDEMTMETGVAIAAMVNTDMRFMSGVARELERRLDTLVRIGGVEAEMAAKGALTTPGASSPVLMADIGAGSTDAAYVDGHGNVTAVHLAGAGNLITMLIDSELDLNSFETAELVKKNPLAKVENLHRIHYEDGNVSFCREPLSAEFYGQVVTVDEEGEMQIVDTSHSIEKIRAVRRDAKRKVIAGNVIRALNKVRGEKMVDRLILIGGSVLDFEINDILIEEMDSLGVLSGRGNIRGLEGPRNAVATGLILEYCSEREDRR